MLAEMIKAIVGLADNARAFKAYEEPGGRHVILSKPNGEVDRIPVPMRRAYHADDLASFIKLLEDVAGETDMSPVVFVKSYNNGVHVTCYFDEDERFDMMSMKIANSPMLDAFQELTTWTKQKEVVNALRDQLFGYCDSTLLPTLRSMDFQRRNDGTRTIQNGSESLGKSVELKVQSKHGEIPERATFTIPWFSARDFRGFVGRIECSVDTDAMQESIRFVPVGDSLEVAMEFAAKSVADTIREEADRLMVAVTVVLGSSGT